VPAPLGDVLASNWVQKGPWLATIRIETPVSISILCAATGKGGAEVFCFRSSSLPHERVKYLGFLESDPLVERDGAIVRLGHGERNETESALAEIST
jgi:hypothetical protein